MDDRSMDRFCHMAVDMGASRAVPISTDDVVVDLRVRLKCQVPRCDSYGKSLMCPPNCLSVKEFKSFLECYEQGIFIQVDQQTPPPVKSRVEETDSISDLYNDRKYIKEYTKDLLPGKDLLHEIVTKVESEAFNIGYYYASGFAGGDCTKCDTCVGPGNPCRFPYYARPSLEAVSVDVFKTAERVGIKMDYPVRDRIVWSGLVLIE